MGFFTMTHPSKNLFPSPWQIRNYINKGFGLILFSSSHGILYTRANAAENWAPIQYKDAVLSV